jgi:hypothetical protein
MRNLSDNYLVQLPDTLSIILILIGIAAIVGVGYAVYAKVRTYRESKMPVISYPARMMIVSQEWNTRKKTRDVRSAFYAYCYFMDEKSVPQLRKVTSGFDFYDIPDVYQKPFEDPYYNRFRSSIPFFPPEPGTIKDIFLPQSIPVTVKIQGRRVSCDFTDQVSTK